MPGIRRSVRRVVVGFAVIGVSGAVAFATGALAARLWPVEVDPATSAAPERAFA